MTRVVILAPVENRDRDGYANKTYVSPLAAPIRVKWINAHGSEAAEAKQLGLHEKATLTTRYRPTITTDCIVQRLPDKAEFEIVSVNDVDNHHRWLEIVVKRRERAV